MKSLERRIIKHESESRVRVFLLVINSCFFLLFAALGLLWPLRTGIVSKKKCKAQIIVISATDFILYAMLITRGNDKLWLFAWAFVRTKSIFAENSNSHKFFWSKLIDRGSNDGKPKIFKSSIKARPTCCCPERLSLLNDKMNACTVKNIELRDKSKR